jgi:hypothetical protein
MDWSHTINVSENLDSFTWWDAIMPGRSLPKSFLLNCRVDERHVWLL